MGTLISLLAIDFSLLLKKQGLKRECSTEAGDEDSRNGSGGTQTSSVCIVLLQHNLTGPIKICSSFLAVPHRHFSPSPYLGCPLQLCSACPCTRKTWCPSVETSTFSPLLLHHGTPSKKLSCLKTVRMLLREQFTV